MSVLLLTIRTAALVLLGLFAGGVFFVVIAPSLGGLPGEAYVRYWQALNLDYGRAMPPLLLTCMALILTSAILSHRRGGLTFGLTLAALLLVVLAVTVTLTQMDPLNRQADAWDPTQLPTNWADVKQRWLAWHYVRTVLAVAAFVGLLTAHAADQPRPTPDSPPNAPATSLANSGTGAV
ncbi:DUF1772 domain-containing protein [Micromonosporaceae bacterium B7E4]